LALISRLARLDTCAVSNAMDKLGLSGAAQAMADVMSADYEAMLDT
jgi:hypothetical protein